MRTDGPGAFLPKHGYKAVLDPGCGSSASCLRATIAHFLEHNPEGTDNERLKAILAHGNGIDIHPSRRVAHFLVRLTFLHSASSSTPHASPSTSQCQHLADSLFPACEVEASLIEQLSSMEITYGGKKDQRQFVMPDLQSPTPPNCSMTRLLRARPFGRSCQDETGIALNDGEPF